MTPEKATDYREMIKQKVAEQLAHFVTLKGTKPERVQLEVHYRESVARIDINLND